MSIYLFYALFIHRPEGTLKCLIFSYHSVKTCDVYAQKNRLCTQDETVLLSIHNILFWLRNKKIISFTQSYLERCNNAMF